MRQVGILAAAGILAIETMTTRLGEDHIHARRLAEGLAQIPGLTLDLAQVQTNMVFFSLDDAVPLDAETFREMLERDYRVKIDPRGGRKFRTVTHYWITSARVDEAVHAMREVLERVTEHTA